MISVERGGLECQPGPARREVPGLGGGGGQATVNH